METFSRRSAPFAGFMVPLAPAAADRKKFHAEYNLGGHTALGISRKVDKASKPHSSYHLRRKLGGMCAHPNRTLFTQRRQYVHPQRLGPWDETALEPTHDVNQHHTHRFEIDSDQRNSETLSMKLARNGGEKWSDASRNETELDHRPTLSTIRVVTHLSKFPRKMRW